MWLPDSHEESVEAQGMAPKPDVVKQVIATARRECCNYCPIRLGFLFSFATSGGCFSNVAKSNYDFCVVLPFHSQSRFWLRSNLILGKKKPTNPDFFFFLLNKNCFLEASFTPTAISKFVFNSLCLLPPRLAPQSGNAVPPFNLL